MPFEVSLEMEPSKSSVQGACALPYSSSGNYIKCLKLIENHLKFSSLKWVDDGLIVLDIPVTYSPTSGWNCYESVKVASSECSKSSLLLPQNPLEDLPPLSCIATAQGRLLLKSWFQTHWLRIILLSILLYIILKFTLVGVLHFTYYSLLKLIDSDATASDVETQDSCRPKVHEFQRRSNGEDLNSIVILIGRWLATLGDPFLSVPELPIVIYYFVAMCPILFFLSNYSLFRQGIRSEHLSFIKDPLEERQLFRRGVRNVIKNFIDAPQLKFSLDMRREYSIQSSSSKLLKSQNYYAKSLKRIFLKIVYQDLVKPANLTDSWLMKLSRYQCFSLGNCEILWIVSIVQYLMMMLAIEFYLQTDEQLKCQDVTSDKFTWHEIYSILLPILRTYLTPARLLFILEIITTLVCICRWGSLNLSLAAFGILHRLQWANQIRQQLHTCIELMEIAKLRSVGTTTKVVGGSERPEVSQQRNTLILVCYLNYAMYRNQYGSFNSMISIIAGKFILMMLLYYLILYATAFHINTIFKGTIAAAMIGVTVLTNLFLMFCIYILTKSEKIGRDIARLLAVGAGLSGTTHRLSMILWCRHLLDPNDLKNLFAIRLFGARIDKTQLVTLNVYLVVLLMLYR